MKKFTMLHMFCGIGGSALGSTAASARFGDHEARFVNVGGVDLDELACRDFERLTGVPALRANLHTLTPAELRRYCPVRPDAVMSSPPCKGFSGLLGEERAAEPKYVEMNRLLPRSLFLLCSTWDTPPPILFFENVPRMISRGAAMVEEVVKLLQAHGYSVHVGNHDCGEIGGLAQHRRRAFILARQLEEVAQTVHLPEKKRVRACGEVLGPLPIPGDVDAAGPMHALPNLHWLNWARLALIPPGGDWRDLPGVVSPGKKKREQFRRLPVTLWEEPIDTVTGPGGSASEHVADPRVSRFTGESTRIMPWGKPAPAVTGNGRVRGSGASVVADPRFGHVEKVTDWDEPVGTVTHSPAPSSGAAAVADPRVERFANNMPVAGWDGPVGTIIGASRPGGGALSVADPRWGGGKMGVTGWDEPADTVTGEGSITGSRAAVADPRFSDGKKRNWQQVAGVTPWTEPFPTVTSGAKIHAGAFQVADPRALELARKVAEDRKLRSTPRAGAYMVMRWQDAAPTVTASLQIDNGAAAVCDPREMNAAIVAELAKLKPNRPPPFVPVIIAADGTWHRPVTTLELGVLQSFPATIDGRPLVLEGTSHTRWRQAIGNAVPPDAAEAVAVQLLRSLLLSSLGMWTLDSSPIWAREHLAAWGLQ